MTLGLRARLIGTVVGAILISTVIGIVAARQTMATDLNRLAGQAVFSGATGFGGYWDQKRDAVKLLVTQAAINDAVRRATVAHDGRALEATLAAIERQGGLSYLTVVDTKGAVVARANGGKAGDTSPSPLAARALAGETVSTTQKLAPKELQPEGLTSQVQTGGSAAQATQNGLGIVSAAPISDANERTIGAIYGGIVANHYYDTVDQAGHALGGKAAVILDGQFVASSISRADGTRLIDERASDRVRTITQPYTGIDAEGGSDYLVRAEPVNDDQNNVVAVRWYGVPLAQYTDIQSHVVVSLVLWGLVGIGLALALALPVVERLSRALMKRARQVRDSAKELSVVIVGSEVSGDHVAQTRDAVERQGELLMQAATAAEGQRAGGGVATAAGVSEKLLAANALNAEILGDVVVMDTLAQEMAQRTQHAVSRVNELNDVAQGLNELVNGKN